MANLLFSSANPSRRRCVKCRPEEVTAQIRRLWKTEGVSFWALARIFFKDTGSNQDGWTLGWHLIGVNLTRTCILLKIIEDMFDEIQKLCVTFKTKELQWFASVYLRVVSFPEVVCQIVLDLGDELLGVVRVQAEHLAEAFEADVLKVTVGQRLHTGVGLNHFLLRQTVRANQVAPAWKTETRQKPLTWLF